MHKISVFIMRFLVFYLVCFRASGIHAQSLKSYDKVEIQTLYINSKDSVVKFQVLSENKDNKYNPSLTYFWYKSNTILQTAGGADGKLLNGDYVCFFPDNNLKEKGKFIKGLKDAVWICWFDNGKIKEQISWKKGVLHGMSMTFDKDGNKLMSKIYKKGVLQVKKERKKNEPVAKKAIAKENTPAKKQKPVKVPPQKK